MPNTIADMVVVSLNTREREIVLTAIHSRISHSRNERVILQLLEFPGEHLFRLEALATANALANLAITSNSREEALREIDEQAELIRVLAREAANGVFDQREGRRADRVEDDCDCAVCQVRRQFEAGKVELSDVGRLLTEAIADEVHKRELEATNSPYMNEEDLKHAAGNPNESSPWGYGVGNSKQVHERELPISERINQPGSADREGGGG
jgi:hypothetical protein